MLSSRQVLNTNGFEPNEENINARCAKRFLYTATCKQHIRTVHDEFIDGVDVILEVLASTHDRRILADLVESLRGDRFEGPPHNRIMFEHGVELVDG